METKLNPTYVAYILIYILSDVINVNDVMVYILRRCETLKYYYILCY